MIARNEIFRVYLFIDGFDVCCQMKQQLHYAWYRMHTSASTDVSDKAKCIGQESRYSVSFIAYHTIIVVISVVNKPVGDIMCVLHFVTIMTSYSYQLHDR